MKNKLNKMACAFTEFTKQNKTLETRFAFASPVFVSSSNESRCNRNCGLLAVSFFPVFCNGFVSPSPTFAY